MITEDEQFDTSNPDLCNCMRWKGMFVGVGHDPNVPMSRDGHFWCVFTATIFGPDGKLVGPIACSSSDRACYGKGRV
jgi:hypothetical protein